MADLPVQIGTGSVGDYANRSHLEGGLGTDTFLVF
jgi:hypothetical protein